MEEDKPFDRALRRLRRDRAARIGGDADYLHRVAAEEIIERLSIVKRDFADALVLGAIDGGLAEALLARGTRAVVADPSRLLARSNGGVQCDEDRLAFADESLDLVVSVGTLDSVNDLPGALTLIRRALRPDGLLLAALSARAACHA
jgi:SAM-dependent methyltransferase